MWEASAAWAAWRDAHFDRVEIVITQHDHQEDWWEDLERIVLLEVIVRKTIDEALRVRCAHSEVCAAGLGLARTTFFTGVRLAGASATGLRGRRPGSSRKTRRLAIPRGGGIQRTRYVNYNNIV